MLAENFDDVLESVLSTVEEVIGGSDDVNRLRKEKKALDNLEQRRKKLTDMLLDDTISKEAYDEKYEEMTTKIAKSKKTIEILQGNAENQKNVGRRMESLRKALSYSDILDEFDRVVFESIVEKVIVGEVNEDGSIDPYKITFVMKGNGNSVIPNAKEHF